MKEIKIAAVSDLHGSLDFGVPQCGILAIAGDVCPVKESHHPAHQRHWLDRKFLPWCAGLISGGTVKAVVMTPGNHDFVFQLDKTVVYPEGVTCLIDAEADVCGVRVYGTPWTPTFGRWAFMDGEDMLRRRFAAVPEGLDILLSHGPARGVCDRILSPGRTEEPLGSRSLLGAVERAKPAWLLCGHIHTGSHDAARICDGATTAVNVSLLDEDYRIAYKPFEFTVRKGE
jgi:Icc-related predicted phosphoesterase